MLGVRRVRQGLSAKAALPLTAPRTSINVAVHARRRVAFAAASLEDVKQLKNAMGTTVNDVVLAMCAGALRTYLEAGDELPEIPLVSVVPVSVTPDVAELKGSNKVSAMFVQLPSQLDDPLERLQVIHEGTKGAKEEHKALGASTLQNWAEHATPNVFAAAARLYTGMKLADRHRPVANMVISNVPGPDFPLYLGGSELLGMFPLGPVMDGMGLNITIMSYRGVLYWGLASDRPRRAPPVGHRSRHPACTDRADGGCRARAPALRRADPPGAGNAADGELGPDVHRRRRGRAPTGRGTSRIAG